MIYTESETIIRKEDVIELPDVKDKIRIKRENDKVIEFSIFCEGAGSYDLIHQMHYFSVSNFFKLMEHYFREKFEEERKPNIRTV